MKEGQDDLSELMQRMEQYGADVEGIRSRFLGDDQLFGSCMQAFMQDENFCRLRKSIEEQNYAAAFDHAHTLKGVAGNLGLTPLYEKVSALVEPLRHKEYGSIEPLFAAVVQAMDNLKSYL